MTDEMREIKNYFKTLTVTAPDELVFGFNPTFVSIQTEHDAIRTSFDSNGQRLGELVLYPRNGRIDVDIMAMLTSAFSGNAKKTDAFPTSAKVDIIFVWNSMPEVGDSRYENYRVIVPFSVVYGAMLPGEMFNASRSVRLWSAYPQVVSFFKPSQSFVLVQKDKTEAEEWKNHTDASEILSYDNQQEDVAMTESGQIVIAPERGVSSTFAMQFDGTFTNVLGNTIINITVDNTPQCDDHIFLRWLDKHGFWQYWLFKIGNVEISDAVVGSALTFLTGTTYPYYATRNIGKSLVKQVTACATNLTEEEWKMLSSIKGSASVCAFDTASQSWVPVNVAAGASAWQMGNQSSHRQDFSLKAIFPTIQTQRL